MGLEATPQPQNQQRWISVYNQNDDDIPPFSFVTPVGVAANGGLVVDAIAEDGDKMAMVTGDTTIPSGEWGLATRDFPTRVTYDSDDGTPAALTIEDWGPKATWWVAKKNVSGWKLIGPAVANMPDVRDLEVDTALIEIEVCRPT